MFSPDVGYFRYTIPTHVTSAMVLFYTDFKTFLVDFGKSRGRVPYVRGARVLERQQKETQSNKTEQLE
eukprot:scaffold8374_cov175-Amphora_coffeaeformis.AAC.60